MTSPTDLYDLVRAAITDMLTRHGITKPPSPLLAKRPEPAKTPEPIVDTDPLIVEPPSVPSVTGQIDAVWDFLAHHTRGRHSVSEAVAEFYGREAAKPHIASYFHAVLARDGDLSGLMVHFTRAFKIATKDGLRQSTLDWIAKVHRNVRNLDGDPITGEIYDEVFDDFAQVLIDMGVPRPAVGQLTPMRAALRRAIVAEPS